MLAEVENESHAYLGLIGSPSGITTLQSRVKIKRVTRIMPAAPDRLAELLETPTHQRTLRDRLARGEGLTPLSAGLSGELINRLATIETNAGAMHTLAAALATPRHFRGNEALQNDAIRIAMKAFGLGADDRADSLALTPDRETALARVPILEDRVIEHDARTVPGFVLTTSDTTGRAEFVRGNEHLQIITANRGQLEGAFGVDLIYLNLTRRNVVMLQYKMLDPPNGQSADWTFVPDGQLAAELARMHRFAQNNPPPPDEYRLNPAIFYLKFVKRDGSLRHSGIIMPIDHYELFVRQPAARGPRGGLRVAYDALMGSYMREQPFLDLIRAGYIGSYADTTASLVTLVDGVLRQGRAVVAAI